MILDSLYVVIFICVLSRIGFDCALMIHHHFKGTP